MAGDNLPKPADLVALESSQRALSDNSSAPPLCRPAKRPPVTASPADDPGRRRLRDCGMTMCVPRSRLIKRSASWKTVATSSRLFVNVVRSGRIDLPSCTSENALLLRIREKRCGCPGSCWAAPSRCFRANGAPNALSVWRLARIGESRSSAVTTFADSNILEWAIASRDRSMRIACFCARSIRARQSSCRAVMRRWRSVSNARTVAPCIRSPAWRNVRERTTVGPSAHLLVRRAGPRPSAGPALAPWADRGGSAGRSPATCRWPMTPSRAFPGPLYGVLSPASAIQYTQTRWSSTTESVHICTSEASSVHILGNGCRWGEPCLPMEQ